MNNLSTVKGPSWDVNDWLMAASRWRFNAGFTIGSTNIVHAMVVMDAG
jgi:hypothetical protein